MLMLTVNAGQSWWVWVVVLGGLALIIGLFYLLDRWLAKRGAQTFGTGSAQAILELQTLLEPSKKHVIEVRREKRQEKPGAGDDDEPSGRGVD